MNNNNNNNDKDKSVHFKMIPSDLAYSIFRKEFLDFGKKISENRSSEITTSGVLITAKSNENGALKTNTFAFGRYDDIISALIAALAKKIKECVSENDDNTKDILLKESTKAFIKAVRDELNGDFEDKEYLDLEF